jgi:hypothetical protein
VTSGKSGMKEASVGGGLVSFVIPLEDMTHTCVEGWRSGGAPW